MRRLCRPGSFAETQLALSDDDGDRYRIPVLGHALTRAQAQAHDAHPEDRACADFIEALLRERPPPPIDRLLAPLRVTGRYRRLLQGREPGFPAEDLELCLAVDAFDFAMRAAGGRLFRVDPDA